MINFLLATVLFLIILIFIVYLFRSMTSNYTYDDEIVVTTTTTTSVVQPTIDQLPTLERLFKPNGQPYVVDPVDKDEWMLNTNDDMYEDGAGKWWKLV